MPDCLTPEAILDAYAVGIFPMADRWGRIDWYSPDPRGVLEHDCLHVSRSLRSVVRSCRFEIRLDTAFAQVMAACAAPRGDAEDTWISPEFSHAYGALHQRGFAHSVEAWQNGKLVGGLYGVAIGGAFLGESMFSRASNASKVCLVALVQRLREQGYVLHDTQMVTPHTARLGATLISRAEYLRRLHQAIQLPRGFI